MSEKKQIPEPIKEEKKTKPDKDQNFAKKYLKTSGLINTQETMDNEIRKEPVSVKDQMNYGASQALNQLAYRSGRIMKSENALIVKYYEKISDIEERVKLSYKRKLDFGKTPEYTAKDLERDLRRILGFISEIYQNCWENFSDSGASNLAEIMCDYTYENGLIPLWMDVRYLQFKRKNQVFTANHVPTMIAATMGILSRRWFSKDSKERNKFTKNMWIDESMDFFKRYKVKLPKNFEKKKKSIQEIQKKNIELNERKAKNLEERRKQKQRADNRKMFRVECQKKVKQIDGDFMRMDESLITMKKEIDKLKPDMDRLISEYHIKEDSYTQLNVLIEQVKQRQADLIETRKKVIEQGSTPTPEKKKNKPEKKKKEKPKKKKPEKKKKKEKPKKKVEVKKEELTPKEKEEEEESDPVIKNVH